MKKVLFLIHDLGPGGAEKVLVNLVNNLDPQQFDVTLMTLFDVGVNKQFLKPHIHYRSCFKYMIRGNSHLMKLLTPRQLHRWLIRERYDIEVSYLEGPSARIISGCPDNDTKKVAWIHCMATRDTNVTLGFRSYQEAAKAYRRFDRVVCVSQTAESAFRAVFPEAADTAVLYNTNESETIRQRAEEPLETGFPADRLNLISTGKLVPIKGFDRLLRVHARLRSDGYPVHCHILGDGELRPELEQLAKTLGEQESVTFWGYQTNPYRFLAYSDLYVCSSLSEGFSTAATESLIVGTPVCTVEVSGMKEMLGENNEWGVVTENSEDGLYQGIKQLLDEPERLSHYKNMAAERGRAFSTEETVRAVAQMLCQLTQ